MIRSAQHLRAISMLQKWRWGLESKKPAGGFLHESSRWFYLSFRNRLPKRGGGFESKLHHFGETVLTFLDAQTFAGHELV